MPGDRILVLSRWPRPVIEEANRVAPAYARIFKEMIIVTGPAKPLPRAAKGTVVRPQALDAYAHEIDNLSVLVDM